MHPWVPCFYCAILINNKNIDFVGDYPMNIPTKFIIKWPDGFRKED